MNHHESEDQEIEAEDNTKDDIIEDWEKGIPPFVRKLTKMVGENPEAIDWTNSGSFMVKEIDSFSSSLLPRYFKSIKFCSFVRQLNMYNFHKVEDLPHSNNKSMEFSNPFFLPGRKDLLKKIHRRKTLKRNKGDEDEERLHPKHEHGVQQQMSPNSYIIDENSYKGLLHAVLRLQQQQETSAKQILKLTNDLEDMKKVNQELQHKVFQLSLQGSGNTGIYGFSASTLSASSAPTLYNTGGATNAVQSNANFNLYANPPNDLSSYLFDDNNNNLNNLNLSQSSGRASLLALINDPTLNNTGGEEEKISTFDFNNIQQQLSEHSSSSSASPSPPPTLLSSHHIMRTSEHPVLYETPQFDVYV